MGKHTASKMPVSVIGKERAAHDATLRLIARTGLMSAFAIVKETAERGRHAQVTPLTAVMNNDAIITHIEESH